MPLSTRVVLVARSLPQLPTPRCGRWMLKEVDAADLAMSAGAVAGLLRRDYGIDDPALATGIHGLTAGWPALVHLVAQAVGPGPATAEDLLDAASAPGTRPAGFLVEEVLDQLPVAARRLVRDLAYLVDIGTAAARAGLVVPGPVHPGLARAVGHRCAGHTLAMLTRSGLCTVDGSAYSMVPLLAAVVRRCQPVPQARRGPLRGAAAGWLAEHGHLAAAVRCHLAGQDLARVRQLLTDPYDERAHRGLVQTLASAGSHGEARRAYGRYAEAMRALNLPAPRQLPPPHRLPVPRPPSTPGEPGLVPHRSGTTGHWPSGQRISSA